jgi:hypothetical protein
MRTKTLLLTAAAIAVGITASQAQVYSVNAVGYVNKNVPVGYSMIANPLNTTNNTIASLIPTAPNFCNLLKWNGTSFDVATYVFGAWDTPAVTLNPGEGAFINTDTAFTITFVGEVMQGNLVNPVPAGYSIRSSQVPQTGGANALGLTTLQAFDNLLKWNGTSYDVYTVLFGGAWDPSEPTIAVGESVFLNTTAATSWNRTFNVNQ